VNKTTLQKLPLFTQILVINTKKGRHHTSQEELDMSGKHELVF
jgi:hypothetical protein